MKFILTAVAVLFLSISTFGQISSKPYPCPGPTCGMIHFAKPAPITAISLTEIQASTATDLGVYSYVATVNISNSKNSKAAIFPNGSSITLTTANCTRVPDAKTGENGILVLHGANGNVLLFASGASCPITSVDPTPAVAPRTKNGHTNPFQR